MSQHSIITERDRDHTITLFRNDQVLLKFFGEYWRLEELAAYWREEVPVNAVIDKAVRLGII